MRRWRQRPAASGGGLAGKTPNLGFPATGWDAEGIHVTRVRRRGDLGRRSRWRRSGAGARRGGGARRGWRSPEASTVSRAHGIESNYTGRLPTFLRSSGSTPCQRSGDDGENPKAAALGFRRGRGRERRSAGPAAGLLRGLSRLRAGCWAGSEGGIG
jgi:hypothetical protein